jgi:hypothetical protein
MNELQRLQYFIGNDMLYAYKKAEEMHKKEIVNTYIIADSESTIEDAEHNAEKYYERQFKND